MRVDDLKCVRDNLTRKKKKEINHVEVKFHDLI